MSKKKASGKKPVHSYGDECNDCLAIEGFGFAIDSIWKLRREARERGSVTLDLLETELELLFNVLMILSEVANRNAKHGLDELKSQLWPKQNGKESKKQKLELVKS